MNTIKETPISPDYLESKGFKRYIPGNESEFDNFPALFDINFDSENDLCFIENKLDRKQFCIVLSPDRWADTNEEFLTFEIYIQDDIGCGFVNIPNQFAEMTEYHFELLYEAIRRVRL